MKNRYVYCVFVLIFIFAVFFGIYRFQKNYISNFKDNRNNMLKVCDENETLEWCDKELKEYNNYKECLGKINKECKLIVKRYEKFGLNSYDTFDYIMIDEIMGMFQVGVTLILFFFLSLYYSKYLTNLTIKNYLCRESYNKYIKDVYVGGVKYSILLVTFVLVFMLYSCLYAGDLSLLLDKTTLFNLIYLLMLSIFYMNLTFICSVGNKNFVIGLAKTILSYFLVVCICEQPRVIFDKFKKIKSFNIVDLIVKENINTYLIGVILLFIISSLIVYVLFKNKERIISMLEKGDNEYED